MVFFLNNAAVRNRKDIYPMSASPFSTYGLCDDAAFFVLADINHERKADIGHRPAMTRREWGSTFYVIFKYLGFFLLFLFKQKNRILGYLFCIPNVFIQLVLHPKMSLVFVTVQTRAFA